MKLNKKNLDEFLLRQLGWVDWRACVAGRQRLKQLQKRKRSMEWVFNKMVENVLKEQDTDTYSIRMDDVTWLYSKMHEALGLKEYCPMVLQPHMRNFSYFKRRFERLPYP